MSKVLILEGPRCSGKTTIASHLHNKHGFSVFKSDRGHDPHGQMIGILNWLKKDDSNWVFDRFHLTELVMRLHDGIRDPGEVLDATVMIHETLMSLGKVNVVVLYPSDVILHSRFITREKDVPRGEDMPVYKSLAFWNFTTHFFPGALKYYPANMTRDEVNLEFSEIIEEEKWKELLQST